MIKANQICRKIYYRIHFVLKSGLSIGKTDSENTDKDMVCDSRGLPYIPGSSLAGIYRAFYNMKTAEEYFGRIEGQDSRESRILVYDAELADNADDNKNVYITTRDNVKLDKWRTAVDGSKFDYEIVAPGTEFVTYIEVNLLEGEDDTVGDVLANAWKTGKVHIGGKTMRGLGQTEVLSLKKARFDLNKPEDVDRWLEFDMYREDPSGWEEYVKDGDGQAWEEALNNGMLAEKKADCITLHLRQKGGISIRRYTTEVGDNESMPDFEQLMYVLQKKAAGKSVELEDAPCIPGTSWTGTFRHHLEGFLGEEAKGLLSSYFGTAAGEGHKSYISFSETYLTGAHPKVMSRNSINRFTGGTNDGALFTERTYYGGEGLLSIRIERFPDENPEGRRHMLKALFACIADLAEGFLAVGGLSSIGRGLFSIVAVDCNGRSILSDTDRLTGDRIYQTLQNEVKTDDE